MNFDDIDISSIKSYDHLNTLKHRLESEHDRKKLSEEFKKYREEKWMEEERESQKQTDLWICERCGCEFEWEADKVPVWCDENQGGCGKSRNKTNFRAKTGIYRFFEFETRKTFIPKFLCDDILEHTHVVTKKDRKEIYIHQDNYFQPGGEDYIKKQTQIRLGKETRQKRKNEVVDYIITETLREKEDFNKNDNLLAVENGVLDTKEKEIVDHEPLEDIITHKLPIRFDPNAEFEGSRVEEFLNEIFYEEDLEAIQRFLGTLLEKNYDYRKIMILHGPTRTGKSLFLELVEKIIGEKNTSNEALQELSKADFSRENLMDNLANIRSDLDAKLLKDTGIIKELSGGDTVNAPRKHIQGNLQFTNYAKLMFSCNTLPKLQVSKITTAFWNRFLIIEVNKNRYPEGGEDTIQKQVLLDQLTSEEEKSAFLNWMLEGLQKLKHTNDFAPSDRIKDGKERWISQTDNLRAFVARYVEDDTDGRIVKKDFYEAYTNHCNNTDKTPYKQSKVGLNLPKILPYVNTEKPKIHYKNSHKQMNCWEGIKLIDEYSKFNRSISNPKTLEESEKDESQTSLTVEIDEQRSLYGQIKQMLREDGQLKSDLYDTLEYNKKQIDKELEKMRTEGEIKITESKSDKYVEFV